MTETNHLLIEQKIKCENCYETIPAGPVLFCPTCKANLCDLCKEHAC